MRLTDDALDKRASAKLKKRGFKSMASDSWEYEITDIFPKSGCGIRISERDTSFTGLGEHKSPSALRNIRWVITQIQAHSTPVIDDGYKRMVKVFKPIGVKGDHIARRLGRTNEQQLDMRYMEIPSTSTNIPLSFSFTFARWRDKFCVLADKARRNRMEPRAPMPGHQRSRPQRGRQGAG